MVNFDYSIKILKVSLNETQRVGKYFYTNGYNWMLVFVIEGLYFLLLTSQLTDPGIGGGWERKPIQSVDQVGIELSQGLLLDT